MNIVLFWLKSLVSLVVGLWPVYVVAFMLYGVGSCTYDRIKYGPPCEQVAESKYVCFAKWTDDPK